MADLQDFDNFIVLAPSVSPNLWKHMSYLRNVKGKYSKRDWERVPGKIWQVLLQMYALKQMRNHHSLKW